jgi:predicted extracellular nuclease
VEEPSVEEPPVEEPVRPISAVQGAGPATPAVRPSVRVEAVVTSLFERNDVLDGFFVQEQDADADDDPLTSEGLFVFCRGVCPAPLATGDLVQVTGRATEFAGMTQLGVAAGGVQVQGPRPGAADRCRARPARPKRLHPRRCHLRGRRGHGRHGSRTLAVSEFFALARFGTITLTAGERPYQFTHSSLPSESGYAAFRPTWRPG